MEPTLVDAVRVYADQVRERTGVRTVSVAEATRMAIRAGLVAAGIDPDAPHAEAGPDLSGVSTAQLERELDEMDAAKPVDIYDAGKAFKGADPLTSRPGGRRRG